MIGYYNYTVILTYIGTFFGFAGVIYSFSGNVKMALICLMLAGICDMFDGKIASTMERTKQEKRFGIQIDSLSDFLCFGVLPALIIFTAANKSVPAGIIAAIYLLCALIRLAWFNVDEEERQSNESECRKTYLGLPVTASALILPIIFGFFAVIHVQILKFLPWILLLNAFSLLTPFSVKKPKELGKLLILLAGIVGFILVIKGM